MVEQLRTFKIKQRFIFLIGIFILSISCIGALSIRQIKSAILDAKQSALQNLIEIAYSNVDYYYNLAQTNKLSLDDAKKSALASLSLLQNKAQTYVWVNDLKPSMLMHPFSPELVGKDLTNTTDASGRKIFLEMIDIVNKNDAAFITYTWSKPGYKKPIEKLSYIKTFKEFGWIIGTGIYLDDLDKKINHEILFYLLLTSISLGIFLIFCIPISMSIIKPITKVGNILKQQMSSHKIDLKLLIPASGNDEITDVGNFLNALMQNINNIFAVMEKNSKLLDKNINALKQVALALQNKVTLQNKEAENVTTSMNEMHISIQQVAKNADAAAHTANDATEETKKGDITVNDTNHIIHNLTNNLDNVATVINNLKEETTQIGTVLDVIRGIADQTNLLALNAAIEAARAGEQGRGFAVVADEVRTLARRTQQSTEEIHDMIGKLQTGANNAVSAMEQSKILSVTTTEHANSMETVLKAISDSVDKINIMNKEIATTTQEQTDFTKNITESVAKINNLSKDTAEFTYKTIEYCDNLITAINALHNSMNSFSSIQEK